MPLAERAPELTIHVVPKEEARAPVAAALSPPAATRSTPLESPTLTVAPPPSPACSVLGSPDSPPSGPAPDGSALPAPHGSPHRRCSKRRTSDRRPSRESRGAENVLDAVARKLRARSSSKEGAPPKPKSGLLHPKVRGLAEGFFEKIKAKDPFHDVSSMLVSCAASLPFSDVAQSAAAAAARR